MFDRVISKKRAKQTLHDNIVGNVGIEIMNILIPSVILLLVVGNLNLWLLTMTDYDFLLEYYGLGFGFKLLMVELLIALIFTPVMEYIITLYQLKQARHQGQKIKLINTIQEEFNIDIFIHFFVVKLVSNIFIILWSFLLYIPGIIKMYSYSQVGYLAIEHPEIGVLDTITASRQMNNGAKFDLFVTDLSFIAWLILTAFTFGIASFYVTPYIRLTKTFIYIVLADNIIIEEENPFKNDIVDVDVIYKDDEDED